MHNSRPMHTDEQDPKAPRPIDRSFGGGIRIIAPHDDPKGPRPLRATKKSTNALEMVEQYGRTTVDADDLDRHFHV